MHHARIQAEPPRTWRQGGEHSSGAIPLLRTLLGALALAPLALACTVATDATPASQSARTTHALVQVRRTDPVGGEPRADALASFVRAPQNADPGELLALAGIREGLPSPGECQTVGTQGDRALRWEQLPEEGVELVPVDELELQTPSGEHHLAPHAFPSVSDWIRGVVYTSRDQQPEAFPSASRYRIRAFGVDGVFDIDTSHESPVDLSAVTVGGVPFAEVQSLPLSAPMDLTWLPSEGAHDVVVVSFAGDDTRHTCTFSDNWGAGTVPPAMTGEGDGGASFQFGQPVVLSVHRVRTEASPGQDGSSVVEVRFDFSVVTDVTFQ